MNIDTRRLRSLRTTNNKGTDDCSVDDTFKADKRNDKKDSKQKEVHQLGERDG